MRKKGVMDEIRELLSQGKSSRDVIDFGYQSGTVYGVPRQLRRNGTAQTKTPLDATPTKAPTVDSTIENDPEIMTLKKELTQS